VLQWAITTGCEFEALYVLQLAAKRGHQHILEWLGDRYDLKELETVCVHAAHGGHLQLLKWLCETIGCEVKTEDVCTVAAKKGHLSVLQYAREANSPLNDEKVCIAAARGSLGNTRMGGEDATM